MAKTDKQATGTVAEETSVNAWRISASKGTRYELRDADEHFTFEAIKPGDAMLLMDETGDNAWGVRRVFLVRRTAEGSIVYFDREFDFVDQPITFVGDGDKRVLRRIDLDVVDTVLNCVHPPHDTGEDHDPQELCQGSFAWFCDMGVADTPANRVYVRKLLETIVTDDLLGPAQGPERRSWG